MRSISSEEIKTPQCRDELTYLSAVLELENREYQDSRICGICCENQRDVVFLNCGHIFCCVKCAVRIKTCPIDQKPISSRYKLLVCDKNGVYESSDSSDVSFGFISDIKNMLFEKTSWFQSETQTLKEQPASEKYVELRSQNNKYKRYFNCIKCNTQRKDVMFAGCCHIAYCGDCAQDVKVCPFDNKVITKKFKTFTA